MLADDRRGDLPRRVEELRASHVELARHIESLRADAAQRPEQQFLILRQLETLQRRVEEIATAAEQPHVAQRMSEIDASVAALGQQLAQLRLEAGENARQQEHMLRQMDGLRGEVEDLSRLMTDIAPRASIVAVEAALRDLARRVEAGRDRGVEEQALAPAEHIAAELRAALKQLDPTPILRNLDEDVAAIARRLEEATQQGDGDAAAMRELARQTAEIKDQLRLLAARPLPLERLEGRVVDLAQRVESLSLGVRVPGASADMAEIVKSIRAIVAAETSNGFHAFNQRLERLGVKFEEAVKAAGAERFDEINARIDEMHKSLAERIDRGAAQKPSTATAAALETLVATLAKKIDAALDPNAHSAAFEELGRGSSGLKGACAIRATTAASPISRVVSTRSDESQRALRTWNPRTKRRRRRSVRGVGARLGDRIDAAMAPGAGRRDVEQLEQQIEQLSRKLDRLANSPQTARIEQLLAQPPQHGRLDELSERIDYMHSALAARIEEGARRRDDTEKSELAQFVEGLAHKIDGALAPSADANAVASLERQITELSSRLDRGEANGAALASIEDKIAELFGRLEETRGAAVEAAEAALRNATIEVLREAASAASQLSPAVKQELDEIRRNQEVSGARTHETLTVVHETLERVVDRLAAFEEELTEIRETPPGVPLEQPRFGAFENRRSKSVRGLRSPSTSKALSGRASKSRRRLMTRRATSGGRPANATGCTSRPRKCDPRPKWVRVVVKAT